jgi:hypothetical protein
MTAFEKGRARVIATFYSFKGGTGRSMALANVACLLGRNLKERGGRVLAIDWDLEAPGLHRYFPQQSAETGADGPGLINYFHDLKALLDGESSLLESVATREGARVLEDRLPLARYLISDVADGLDLMKAGRFDEDYRERVAGFDWADFHRRYHPAFRAVRDHFTASHYWCLIDSRTGLTDVSGVCTMLMPEKLIGVFTPNRQSVDGLLEVIEQAISYRRESDDPRPLSIFPLPSRVIAGELELSREARADYRARFERCFEQVYAADAVDLKPYFDEVEIPHKDYYGFGEKVAIRDDPNATDALSINQAYQRFYERLVRDDAAWQTPDASEKIPKVYISSTFEDLGPYRAAIREAALAAGFQPVLPEELAADSRPMMDYIHGRLSESDLVVAVVAYRYGWTAPGEEKSLAWQECEYAVEQGKPLFAFVVDPNFSWPLELRESYRLTSAVESGNLETGVIENVQANVRRLKDFKEWLARRSVIGRFTTPDDLRSAATESLNLWRQMHPEFGPPGISKYLDFLREQCSWFDIRGLQTKTGKAPRLPVRELYIPLTIAASANGGGGISLEEAKAHSRLVLVGDPGSGKTTALRHLALAQLEDFAKDEEEAALPFLLRLGELLDHIRRQRDSSLAEDSPAWLLRFLSSRNDELNLGLSPQFMSETLEKGRCLLLLDGLDEVPNGRDTDLLVRLLEKAAQAYRQTRFIVTTRPSAYAGPRVLPSFEIAHIELLEDSAIETFLERWCSALVPESAASATRHFAELSDALRSVPEIRRMARNPVMLTALAVVHWNERQLPEQRADLYESILNWLARSREQLRGRASAERCLTLLQQLALAMQSTPEGRQVEVEKGWAAAALASEFKAGAEAERLALNFVEEEEADSGIIVSRGSAVRFWHLTFQDYLAARAIASLREVDQRSLLLDSDRVYRPEWREIALLLAGVLARQGVGKVNGLFRAVLDRLGLKATLAAKARCAALLSAIVNDLKPLDYQPSDARYQQLMGAVLGIFERETAKEIEFTVRLETAEALGQAGDPRLRQQNWVRIGGHGNVRAFEIGKYPVTVAEYQRFMEDGGYSDERWWRTGRQGTEKEPRYWEDQKQHPNRAVTAVNWYEAAAYASWCGARLPEEAEWELAARGKEGREYPWGKEEPDESRANYLDNGPRHPTPVGLYPWGATPEGVQDMAGNVWEWVDTWSDEKKKYRVLRGGSWYYVSSGLRASGRRRAVPASRSNVIGFRVAREVSFP